MKRLIIITLILLSVSVIHAQENDEETCTTILQTVLEAANEACTEIGLNQACYGHNLIEVETTDTISFDAEGDLIDITALQRLITTPFNPEEETWGIAFMSLQANLEDVLPGQAVTIVLFGDTAIEPVESEVHNAPMQAFRISNGIGQASCATLPPDGLLIQSPEGEIVQLQINDVDISIGSTAFFRNVNEDQLQINNIEGTVEATSQGITQRIDPGFTLTVDPQSPPGEPQPWDNAVNFYMPVELLPDPVVIPVTLKTAECVASNVHLESGETFSISAHGSMSLWPPCNEYCTLEYCTQLCDAILDISPAGSVPIGGIVPDSVPYMSMPNEPLVGLIGKIEEDGDYFFIGAEGTFTAPASGMLYLCANEDQRVVGDETGAFVVTINTEP